MASIKNINKIDRESIEFSIDGQYIQVWTIDDCETFEVEIDFKQSTFATTKKAAQHVADTFNLTDEQAEALDYVIWSALEEHNDVETTEIEGPEDGGEDAAEEQEEEEQAIEEAGIENVSNAAESKSAKATGIRRFFAYVHDAKTNRSHGLMRLDVDTIEQAIDALEHVFPAGSYETLRIVWTDGEAVYAHWRDDEYDEGGWFQYGADKARIFLAEVDRMAAGELMDYSASVNFTKAAQMLGVSRPRISQLVKAGQLETVDMDGRTMILKSSVMKRIEDEPRAGRRWYN